MKKSIFTLAILLCALVGKAQVTDEQSAILQNGDNAQIFYGADALKEALAAAPTAELPLPSRQVLSMGPRLPNV